ncbi:hypothetical protein [Amycolatopsis jiangsuensis]|uniref:Uncharacterized protein n=1 Tax=Amycolatopsis jiangsuensis TaxID=1181879 RepID=A0A840IWX0_9PSEU|nr:hypothetical protein [Amycolatopsis jiangsuensis]MBB4685807.1 hypothetical protein [Amycolatopsis jiangsuensis]
MAQPGYPSQPQGFAAQPPPGQPFPGQPQQAWPGQPYPGQPQAVSGPLTTAGLGAIPAGIGIVLQVVALVAVPWVSVTSTGQPASLTFLDLIRASANASGFTQVYVQIIAIVATVLMLYSSLAWTLGAYRGRRSTRLLSGIRSRELTRANFWWYRTVNAARAVVILIVHVAGIIAVFSDDFSVIGLGPWLLAGGGLLIAAGMAVGPRQGPGLP